MKNNLYENFGAGITEDMFNQISQGATQLKKSIKGNPQEIVENMVKSGQIPQQVFNKIFPIARELGEKMSKNGFNR